jgi:hypothetical protein
MQSPKRMTTKEKSSLILLEADGYQLQGDSSLIPEEDCGNFFLMMLGSASPKNGLLGSSHV